MRTALLALVEALQSSLAAQGAFYAAGSLVAVRVIEPTFRLFGVLRALVANQELPPEEFNLPALVQALPDPTLRTRVEQALRDEKALAPLWEPGLSLPSKPKAG